MLDLFSIFSKGGIVLWCFQSTGEIFSPSVNALIRSVILQERSGNNTFNHNALTLQYKLDNEFELVFVVAYQRILQLSYVDKFLNDVHLEFRDKYKNELQSGPHIMDFDFKSSFDRLLRECEQWAKSQAKLPKQMRTFEDSQKSKKTVASMIERKGEEKGKKSVKIVEATTLTNGKVEEIQEPEDDVIAANRAKLAQKMSSQKKKDIKKSPKSPKVTERVKQPRVWNLGGDSRDLPSLDFSTDKPGDNDTNITPDTQLVGQMTGAIRDLEVESEESSSEDEVQQSQASPKKSTGMFSILKGLVGSKALSEEAMRPVLDKLRDHLIAKNVAADIANKLCDSVANKLEGKVLGTFDSVAKTIKATLTESLVQILSPKRRVDILRDCIHAKQEGRPYVMAFCGVNGVGKSTNLAKICFWLIENDMSVLIAACDTFRAGAVEQLRTHTRHLNALHPASRHAGRDMVTLYEKGYVKIVEATTLTNGKVEEIQEPEDDVIAANRAKLAQKMSSQKKKDIKKSPKSPKVTERVKQPRVWNLGGDSRDLPSLDFSTDKPGDNDTNITPDTQLVGQMTGAIRDLEVESEESSSEDEVQQSQASPKKSTGMFSILKGLVGSKALSEEAMRPVLDKLRDHLIAKNVAADIANKLCNSVANKLEGKVLGTFDSVAKTIKATLTESLVQILSPKRRVDILRDCIHAKQEGRPYVMAFCGVNGVGKSTNLAKICFWLIENDMSVLIAACDTFRAGAVEQLRTHTRHLNALHPASRHAGRDMVTLYEKGYGKDAAGIAMEAIRYANDTKTDIVLIDTAGRMQDNEPLMRALAKLIKVNEPDMVLFVGEALVGNEAVDQLVKFNQALADHSSSTNPHVIDGIVLTKFDTIDDKVGAAISMTYITGQPIVFVGTGQTYTDLKALNVNAVVHALMK